MDLTERAREVFAADRYACELTGIDIVRVAEHEATCQLMLDQRHRNARGVAMGGVLFTMADFCAAVAANSTCLEEEELHWVSLDSTIHFLSPATGNSLRATSKALKSGRATALYQTVIESLDNGKTIAIVETTMIKL